MVEAAGRKIQGRFSDLRQACKGFSHSHQPLNVQTYQATRRGETRNALTQIPKTGPGILSETLDTAHLSDPRVPNLEEGETGEDEKEPPARC
jgi:hypothetical protein